MPQNKPEATLIYFLLDKSASMARRWTETLTSLAKFFEDQAKQPGECLVTFATFDSPGTHTEWLEEVPVANFTAPGSQDIMPDGDSTALYDATLKSLGQLAKYVDTYGKTILVVMTDGEENASRECKSYEAMRATVEKARSGGIEVMYLGVAPEAWSQRDAFATHTVRGTGTAQSLVGTLAYASQAVSNYRSQSERVVGAQLFSNGDLVDDDGVVKDDDS